MVNLFGQRNDCVHGVVAFARNRMPIRDRVFPETGVKEIADLPLFPAAKIRVHPVPPTDARPLAGRVRRPGSSSSVALFWSFPGENASAQVKEFRDQKQQHRHREIGRHYWITANKTQLWHIPAGLPVQVEFQNSDSDVWIPRNPVEPLNLASGATMDFQLMFDPAIQVSVQAVGPKGNPVAGVSIRRLMNRGEEQVWAVGHETDSNGIARFHVPRNAAVTFGALADVFNPRSRYFEVRVEVSTKEFPPRKPFQIRLTDEQIKSLFDRDDGPQ